MKTRETNANMRIPAIVAVIVIAVQALVDYPAFSQVSDEALATWITFDEQKGTTVGDQAPHGYTRDRGTLEGDTRWTADGVFGGAIHFPGKEGSYIRLERSGDIQALSGPNPRSHKHSTFALWFKCEEMNRPKSVQTIFETGGYHNNVNIFVYEGVLHIGLCSGYPFKPSPGKPPALQKPQWMNTRDNLGTDASFKLADGVWHHMALTVEGNDTPNEDGFKVYLDGQFAMSAPGVQIHEHGASAGFGGVNDEAIYPRKRDGWTPIPTNPKAPDAIARLRPDSETRGIRPFAGDLDDFRLYSRVLSAEEISALHNDGREAVGAEEATTQTPE